MSKDSMLGSEAHARAAALRASTLPPVMDEVLLWILRLKGWGGGMTCPGSHLILRTGDSQRCVPLNSRSARASIRSRSSMPSSIGSPGRPMACLNTAGRSLRL